jgi:hypothetical protein
MRLKYMSRNMLAVAALSSMFVAGLLFAQNSREPATATELADSALPPDLDRVLRDYERAWSAGDAKAIALLFTEDGVLLQNHNLADRTAPLKSDVRRQPRLRDKLAV